MKKSIRTIAAAVIFAAVMLCVSACGSNMSRYNGDWTVSTIDGKTPEEYADENDLYKFSVYFNFTFNDSTMTSSRIGEDGTLTEATYSASSKEDSVEIVSGKSAALLPYDSGTDTLTFRVQNSTGTYMTYIMKRGSTDIRSMFDKEMEEEADAAETEAETASENEIVLNIGG